MIRVIVVDDDPFVCASLQTILGAQEDIEVVAVGTSGEEATELFEAHVPDVLLLDIQMAGSDGLSAAESILAKHTNARVVFLTTFADDDYIVRALHMGAKGYLIYLSANNKKWTKKGSTTKTSVSISKLTGGKKIYVKVIAVNQYGVSSTASAVKAVTVKK